MTIRTTRRHLLKTSGVAVGGILASVNSSVRAATTDAPAKQAIVILLQGGCSQLDTWDLKPDAPAEYRGEFQSIATSLPGYRVCEHLPLLAARTGRFNVLRSVYHGTPSHEAAIHWVLTGGGLKTGQVLGTSNSRAEVPHDRPIHFNDVLATIYQQLGVVTDRVFNDAGRPVPVLYQGTPIAELL
jgi:uncharacterized protein (DUF1501 family)